MQTALSSLEDEKPAFLTSIQEDVHSYILSCGSHCIDVVERNLQTDIVLRTHRASLDPDFVEILYKFVRQKSCKGYKLDSALTDPICDLVSRRYQSFYAENTAIVSNGIVETMTSDNLILQSLLKEVANKCLHHTSGYIREKLVEKLVHQVHDSIAQGTLHTVHHQVGIAATHAASSTVGAAIIQIFAKLLAAHIGTIISKVMASAAIKKVIALASKKVVGGVLVSFLASHIAAAAGGVSVAWIVLPALGVYLVYKINTFPRTLARKVSESVKNELSERFYGMNKDILDRILEEVLNGEKLVEALACDKEVQKMMEEMVASL